MRNLIATTAILATLAAPALAFGIGGTDNTNINTNAQAQGQAQGQVQGQTSRNRNSISNKTEGSVAASVGAAACANGVSAGVPGGVLGASWSSKDCRKMMAAKMLLDAGAITVQDFRMIVMSTNALRGFK